MKLSLERLYRTVRGIAATVAAGGTDMGMTIIALAADPTVTATGSAAMGVVGTFGGKWYWHVTDQVDTEWIDLANLKDIEAQVGNVLLLTGAANPIMAAAYAGTKLVNKFVTYDDLQVVPAATTGTIDLGYVGDEGAVADARLCIKTPFAATGSPEVRLYLGGNTLQTLSRLVNMQHGEVANRQDRVGDGLPTDQDPDHVYLSCKLANNAAMSTMSAGEVLVQVWFWGT
jgi:hypothetical protein